MHDQLIQALKRKGSTGNIPQTDKDCSTTEESESAVFSDLKYEKYAEMMKYNR